MNTVAAPTRDPMYLPQPEPVIDAELRIEVEFLSAALGGDMKAKAEFAPLERFNLKGELRRPTVGEVMACSLDFTDGPELDQVLALLSEVARGKDQKNKAMDLITRMAKKYAEVTVREDQL